MEDAEVIKRVKRGEVEAFSIIVERYHKKLLGFLFALTGDRDLAEDIGQDVFLSVYKSLEKFEVERGTPFSAWLFITARNRCISELRGRARNRTISLDEEHDIESGSGLILDAMVDEERIRVFAASLDQLEEPYKRTIIESINGFTLQEIAMRERVAVGTVKSRLFRAREMLKNFVKEYLGDKGYGNL